MDFLALESFTVFAASGVLSMIGSGLSVVLGLGAVIFFHELGHFAVAKWCDVHVERFSIGIGPIIWSRQKGETEYALSALPFGGYVKMLGQDDMDPNQMTADEIAENPRSYSSKKVWQRMAIISAGVIMNVITGFMFFATAYWMGLVEPIERIGLVLPGGPAWTEGIRPGDLIEEIDGTKIQKFEEIKQEVVLSSGSIRVKGTRADGSPFDVVLNPKMGDLTRGIGCGMTQTTTIATKIPEDKPITLPGFAANDASMPFEPGDKIVAMNGEEIEFLHEMSWLCAKYADQEIAYTVERPIKSEAPETDPEAESPVEKLTITVPPKGMRSLGLWMAIGEVSAIQNDSIAAKAGLQVKDQIVKVDELEIGKDIDPLFLPNYFAEQAGKEVVLIVDRQRSGDSSDTIPIKVVPTDAPGWSETPGTLTAPLPIPSIGAAFHVQPRIAHIVPGSEAEESGKFKVGQRITKVQLLHRDPKNIVADLLGNTESTTIELPAPGDEDAPKGDVNWANVFHTIQRVPARQIRIHVADQADGSSSFGYLFEKDETIEGFYTVYRGIRHFPFLTRLRVADGVGDACALGFRETKASGVNIYLTLRSLVTRNLSAKALSGPLGIVNIGYQVASDGPARLLKFLGFLSINLAVLNFLPIPVLDGGHMVFLIWEGVTRRKPSPKVINYAHGVGLIFIITLFVFVLYLDIFVNGLG